MTEQARLNSLESKVSDLSSNLATLAGKLDSYIDEKREFEKT